PRTPGAPAAGVADCAVDAPPPTPPRPRTGPGGRGGTGVVLRGRGGRRADQLRRQLRDRVIAGPADLVVVTPPPGGPGDPAGPGHRRLRIPVVLPSCTHSGGRTPGGVGAVGGLGLRRDPQGRPDRGRAHGERPLGCPRRLGGGPHSRPGRRHAGDVGAVRLPLDLGAPSRAG